MARLIFITDTHGHYTELMGLYQQVLDSGFDPQRDTLIHGGDENDGGPDTRKVIDQLISWQYQYPHWVFLRGNHGQMMLDALSGKGEFDHWWYQGGQATALSYVPDNLDPYQRSLVQPEQMIDPQHIHWLSERPLLSVTHQYVFVHAGLIPNMTIQEHLEALDDPTVRHNLIWIRDTFIDSKFDWGKRVIFGHTALKEPLVMSNKVGCDTMIFNSNKLTAVELDPDDFTSEPRFFFQPAVELDVPSVLQGR